MSNLSELLPTGGGQNAVDFVASGTLSSGQTVALKTDGTVEAVAETTVPTSIGSENSFGDTLTSSLSNIRTIYDAVNSRFIVGWYDGWGYKLRVGTVSGTSITWGAITTKPQGYGDLDFAYDPSTGYILLIEIQTSWDVRVGTISGTTITLSSNLWGGRSDVDDGLRICFDTNSGRFLAFAARDNLNSGYLTCVPIKVNSTSSVSIGTATTVASIATTGYNNAVYDTVNGQTLLGFYEKAGSPSTSAFNLVAVNDSGSGGVSIGSVAKVGTSTDTGGNGIAVSLSQNANGNSGVVLCGTYAGGTSYPIIGYSFTVSGTTITPNASGYTFDTIRPQIGSIGICYSPTSDKYILIWNRQASNAYYSVASVSVSGTISATNGTLNSSNPYAAGQALTIDTDTDTNQVFLPYGKDISGTRSAHYKLLTPTYATSNNTDFIGITAEAIANTATGAVNVYGGINEAQTGLTIGSDYYVQADGSLSTTASTVKVGKAISATTINMMDLT